MNAMIFRTPYRLEPWFYLGFDTAPLHFEESFGIAVGPLYLGRYDGQWYHGILDANGSLPDYGPEG